jgi:dihydrofolate reductase
MVMSKVRVAGFGVSIDGYGAGPDQSVENPLGVNGPELHRWFFPTRYFRAMTRQDGGTTGVDNDFGERSMHGFGAYILGRNMFGPIRGEWTDDEWKGRWGPNPPYHAPTFILTHHPRDPIVMEGGTTFYFISEGIESALKHARAAAGDLDVKIGGGVSAVRQYLIGGHVDELHLVMSPVVLGGGENLFEGMDLRTMGYQVRKHVATEAATHIVLAR